MPTYEIKLSVRGLGSTGDAVYTVNADDEEEAIARVGARARAAYLAVTGVEFSRELPGDISDD